MLSNIRERLCLSKLCRNLINEYNHSEIEEFCYTNKELSKIVIKSFIGYDKIVISHKDIDNVELQFPIQTPLNFDINYLEEEIRRFASIYSCDTFIKSKYKKRRLIIYQNNPMLIGLLDYLLSLNNYVEYHMFSGSNESYNVLNHLSKKYKWIRMNEVETSFASMLRLSKNDYDEVYNDIDRNKNDHKIVFFSKNNSISEISTTFQWLTNFYISMPSNNFIVDLLRYVYRDYHKIDIISNSDGYMLLHVTSVSLKNTCTIEAKLNKLDKWRKNKKKALKNLYRKTKTSIKSWWLLHRQDIMPMRYGVDLEY